MCRPCMAEANFKAFFLGLNDRQRERFAKDAGTTVGYLMAHVIDARKRPMDKLFIGLVKACAKHAGPSENQLLKFFYATDRTRVRVA